VVTIGVALVLVAVAALMPTRVTPPEVGAPVDAEAPVVS
jgi:hypothetical protein